MLLLIVALFVSAAQSAPTVEEDALRAALEGRAADSVRRLERQEDPRARWLAGRYALVAGLPEVAARLFAGGGLGAAWGRIDAMAARGEVAAAAKLAIAEMEAALGGAQRREMTGSLRAWAAERAAKDPKNAAVFLRAARGAAPDDATRRAIEEELFLLELDGSDEALAAAALERAALPDASVAARIHAAMWRARRGDASLALLAAVDGATPELPREAALVVGRRLTRLSAPDAEVLRVVRSLAARWPEDDEMTRLYLNHARAVSERDEALGTAALLDVSRTPRVRAEALRARAEATRAPMERRALWLEISTTNAGSSEGESARAAADEALLAALAEGTPADARAVARRELASPDAASRLRADLYATVSWYALDDAPPARRIEALRALVSGSASFEACTELSELLVTHGTDLAGARGWTDACGHVTAGEPAAALAALTAGAHGLWLLPAEVGGRALVATGSDTATIHEHTVDPEALLRATDGPPLDAQLDAFLLEPERARSLALPTDRLAATPLRATLRAPLVAVTVRTGALRATTLLLADPLEVQVVRAGNEAAIAVLRAGVPVAGADVLAIDPAGEARRARTGRDGIAALSDVTGALRVLARSGLGVGFAEADAVPIPASPLDVWSVDTVDRAVSPEGANIGVFVLATRARGGVTGRAIVVSRSVLGDVLAERPLRVDEGVGRTEIFAQGDGTLEVVEPDTRRVLATVTPHGSGVDQREVALTADADPDGSPDLRPGRPARVTVRALSPEALHRQGTLVVDTPTGASRHPIDLAAGPASLELPLPSTRDGDRVAVRFESADGGTLARPLSLAVSDAPLRILALPPAVAVGAELRVDAPAGSWVLARSEGAERTWAPAGTPLRLPHAGPWTVCAWRDRCGPESRIEVGDAVHHGRPALRAAAAGGVHGARIVRDGEPLLGAPPDVGSSRASVVVAGGATLANDPAPPLRIDALGTPTHGRARVELVAPSGSRIWAFVRDAGDRRRGAWLRVAQPLDVAPGGSHRPWSPVPTTGEAIAAGLLDEEARLAEATEVRRLDYTFGADEERALDSIHGYGSGGGSFGSASHAVGGVGGGAIVLGALDRATRAGHAPALAVLEGGPGVYEVEVPAWVGALDLELVVRSEDGRWQTLRRVLPVRGGPGEAPPERPRATLPDAWDGAAATLVAAAAEVPFASRAYAFTALATAGVPGTSERAAALRGLASARRHVDGAATATPVSRLLAEHLVGRRAAIDETGRPAEDRRHAERAEAALRLAAADPERASAGAARLLLEPTLEPWVRARATLALWVSGDAQGAREAIGGPSAADAAIVSAVRAIVLGQGDLAAAPAWWRIARTDAAHPEDRAIAIHALSLLVRGGRAARTTDTAAPDRSEVGALNVTVEAPYDDTLGSARGVYRVVDGDPTAVDDVPMPALAAGEAPMHRRIPVWVDVPASTLPTRVACPDDDRLRSENPWIDLDPSDTSRSIRCVVRPRRLGPAAVTVRVHAADGVLLARGTAPLVVTPWAPTTPEDRLSPRERFRLGVALAARRDLAALGLLEPLLRDEPLPQDDLRAAATAVLALRAEGDPAAFVRSFLAFRERVPGGALDLRTAAALARAYAATGEPARALATTRIVMDARFKEELAAVSAVRDAGLALTALKLLRDLVDRYPEGPTVSQARFLAPSMLLARADGDGDRLGYTRSSLRHTAVAELAAWLMIHPEADDAGDAATMLVGALATLAEPERERALTGPLARRYPDATPLRVAHARATLAAGDAAGALRLLAGLEPTDDEPAILRGRALEALGRRDEAREAYVASGASEGYDRAAWLAREAEEPPPWIVLQPGDPAVLRGWAAPGTALRITAIRVALEAIFLRDNGRLDPDLVNVAGLRATATRSARVGPDGDVPMPALPDGAYLLLIDVGGVAYRTLLVKTDAELDVRGDDGTLVHLSDRAGRPLPDAQLWAFGGDVQATRTDADGAAWLPGGAGGLPLLARRGDRYAFANLDAQPTRRAPAPAPSAPKSRIVEDNAARYEQLFEQGAAQELRADSL